MPDKDGFLTKKGGIRKNWLKRWFELDRSEHELAYFGMQSSTSLWVDRKGSIDTTTIVSVHEGTAPSKTSEEFEVETADRTYRFRAESAGDRDSWIEALNDELLAVRTELFGEEKASQMQVIMNGSSPPAKQPIPAVDIDPSIDFVEWLDPVHHLRVRFESCPQNTFVTVTVGSGNPCTVELLWFDLDWDGPDECRKALVRTYKHNPARFGQTRDETKLGRAAPGVFCPDKDPERIAKVTALGALCKKFPSVEAPTLSSYTDGGMWRFPHSGWDTMQNYAVGAAALDDREKTCKFCGNLYWGNTCVCPASRR